MGVVVKNPKNVCYDNKTKVTNMTIAGSIINKKYLALAYYFCREKFSTEVICSLWVEGKYNIADSMKKALGTIELHTHANIETSNLQGNVIMCALCSNP